jgi:hypothetical protein
MNKNKAVSKDIAPSILEVRSSFTTAATSTADSLSGFYASSFSLGSFLLLSVFAIETNISFPL